MPGPESAHVRPTPPALDHAALLAVADGAPPVLVVSCTAPGRRCTPQVEHANPAARELLGIDTADTADTVAVPSTEAARGAGDRPRHWMRVLTELVDAGDIDPRAWHTASTPSPVGLPITLRLRVQPLADGTRFLVWMRATTDELALAEEAAADAENRFQRLAQSAAVGIVASDVGARLSFVNAAFAAIVGLEPDELVGTGWLRRIVTDDLPALLGDLERVVVGEPVDRTLRMYGRDRPVRWVRLRLTPTATHHRAGGFIGTVEDVTGRRARESKLAYDATHDALTGLINRRRLMELLKDVYESPARRRHDMALLFCDLDGFKAVNDRFGHDAGDRVLVEVASRLGAEGREDDLVARLAGDEFVVVLRDVTAVDQAVAAAQRRSSALRRPITVEGQLLTVGASIGVAMLRDHGDLTALLRAADAAMYRAKVSGGGVAARQATPEQESA